MQFVLEVQNEGVAASYIEQLKRQGCLVEVGRVDKGGRGDCTSKLVLECSGSEIDRASLRRSSGTHFYLHTYDVDDDGDVDEEGPDVLLKLPDAVAMRDWLNDFIARHPR